MPLLPFGVWSTCAARGAVGRQGPSYSPREEERSEKVDGPGVGSPRTPVAPARIPAAHASEWRGRRTVDPIPLATRQPEESPSTMPRQQENSVTVSDEDALVAMRGSFARAAAHLERGEGADAESAVADGLAAVLEVALQPLLSDGQSVGAVAASDDDGRDALVDEIALDVERVVVPATLGALAGDAAPCPDRCRSTEPGPLYERLRGLLRRMPFLARVHAAIEHARAGGYDDHVTVHLVEMRSGWAVPMQPDEVPVAHQAIGDLFAAVTAPARRLPRLQLDEQTRNEIAEAMAEAFLAEVL